MEAFIRDLKHSLRMFAQSPAFTLAAVAALTLGIGANTAIFSVVNAVLLKPVAMPDADRVVVFLNVSPRGRGGAASPAKFMHYRQQDQVVQDVSAFNTGVMNYTGGTFPEQLRSGLVTADFFKLTGAPVILGRTFLPEEDLPHGPRVVVISRQLWETRFSADPNVVGKSMSLGGDPYTIVGVLGEFDFREFGPVPQVWTLFQFDPNTDDRGHYFQAIGRLKPGVTLQQADARLAASADEYRRKFPTDLGAQATFGLRTVRDQIVSSDTKQSLLVYGGAVS
jgi:putative ABC transport system permease protein